MSTHIAWSIVAGSALGLGLWLIASLAPRLSRPRLATRIAPYLQDVSVAARETLTPAPPGPLPVLGMLIRPVTVRAGLMLGVLLGGSAVVARRLRQANSPITVEGFRAQQLLWGLAGLAVGVAALIVIPSVLSGVLIVLAAGGGIVVRDVVLHSSAARRLVRLEAELPVVLEFLTLSLSAGEGILDAIRRVVTVGTGELSGEFARVVASVSTGLPFGRALSDLAKQLDLPPLTRLVEQMVGALERGSPLAEVLRAQAQDSRRDAKRHLLEAAGRKEVAMLFPVVFLILPITIAFAIFPGVAVLQLGF